MSVEEAWWDRRVTNTNGWRIAGRVFLYLPYAINQSAALWIGRYLSYHELPKVPPSWNPVTNCAQLFRFCAGLWVPAIAATTSCFLTPLLLLLAPFALVAYFLIRFIQMLGIQWAKRTTDKIRIAIVDTLGDIWAYVDSGDRVLAFVLQRHREMRDQYDEVVLVGHSQGAELTRRACLDGPPPDAYVAVGSGHLQLLGARTAAANKWMLAWFWTAALGTPIFLWCWTTRGLNALGSMAALQMFGEIVAVLGQGEESDPWAWWRPFLQSLPETTFVLGATLIFWVLTRKIAHPADGLKSLPCPTWIIRSPWDPVSFDRDCGGNRPHGQPNPPYDKSRVPRAPDLLGKARNGEHASGSHLP